MYKRYLIAALLNLERYDEESEQAHCVNFKINAGLLVHINLCKLAGFFPAGIFKLKVIRAFFH